MVRAGKLTLMCAIPVLAGLFQGHALLGEDESRQEVDRKVTKAERDRPDDSSPAVPAKARKKTDRQEPAAPPAGKGAPDLRAAGGSGTPHGYSIDADMRIRKTLNSPATVQFIEMPLKDAFSFLHDQHHINLWLDGAPIADEGIQSDQPITLQVTDVTLATVLNLMLEPLNLDYVVQDGVLRITTNARAFETRVYNIKGLLEREYSHEDLIDSIRSGVMPDSWSPAATDANYGGQPGSSPETRAGGTQSAGRATIHPVPNALVIRQISRGHTRIERLLIDLENVAKDDDDDDR